MNRKETESALELPMSSPVPEKSFRQVTCSFVRLFLQHSVVVGALILFAVGLYGLVREARYTRHTNAYGFGILFNWAAILFLVGLATLYPAVQYRIALTPSRRRTLGFFTLAAVSGISVALAWFVSPYCILGWAIALLYVIFLQAPEAA